MPKVDNCVTETICTHVREYAGALFAPTLNKINGQVISKPWPKFSPTIYTKDMSGHGPKCRIDSGFLAHFP